VKLLLDEHYANEIAVELRSAGHDAVTVSELGIQGIADEPLLALATSEDRALLSNNARDFLPIVARWGVSGREHCGVLLTSDASMPRHKGSVGLHAATLRAVVDSSLEPRALANQVRWLP